MTSDFDPPEADWTNDYDWTRFRGPDPWPCPAGWVLNDVEMLSASWYNYSGIGEGQGTDSDVTQIFEPDYEALDDAREEMAILIGEDVAESVREERIEWELTIEGDPVFRRVEPEEDNLMAAVAEALSKSSNGADWQSVKPSTGTLPDDVKRELLQKKRKAENMALDGFDGGDA